MRPQRARDVISYCYPVLLQAACCCRRELAGLRAKQEQEQEQQQCRSAAPSRIVPIVPTIISHCRSVIKVNENGHFSQNGGACSEWVPWRTDSTLRCDPSCRQFRIGEVNENVLCCTFDLSLTTMTCLPRLIGYAMTNRRRPPHCTIPDPKPLRGPTVDLNALLSTSPAARTLNPSSKIIPHCTQ